MYHFIVNPNSRTGRGAKIWTTLQSLLDQQQVTYKHYLTRHSGHACSLAASITKEEPRVTIVVVGGDGTMNEVVTGIADYSRITLGYIPTGSSNDFARGFSLPSDPKKALQNILHPKHYSMMDVGVLQYQNKEQNFAVSTGLGFDASICQEALTSRIKTVLNTIHLGKLTYAMIAVKQLFSYKPADITVKLDDTRTLHYKKVYFASVMNHRYEGGGLMLTPKARPDDGKLDVFIVEGYPKPVILALLPTAFFGLHTRFKRVHICTCQKAEIISRQPAPVHTDGESCQMQTSAVVSLAPQKLRIIAAP